MIGRREPTGGVKTADYIHSAARYALRPMRVASACTSEVLDIGSIAESLTPKVALKRYSRPSMSDAWDF